MIKRLLLLLFISIFVVPMSYSDNANSTETKDINVPIRISKDGGGPNKHAPSVAITASVSIYGSLVYFKFPFEEYPIQVEIELETSPYGYWLATLIDEQSYLDGFDGGAGDYKLTVTTAEGVNYVGYFSLE